MPSVDPTIRSAPTDPEFETEDSPSASAQQLTDAGKFCEPPYFPFVAKMMADFASIKGAQPQLAYRLADPSAAPLVIIPTGERMLGTFFPYIPFLCPEI